MEAFAIDVLVLSGQCQWMTYSSDSLLTISLVTCSVNLRDAHDYLTTKRDMEIIGISEKEQDAVFKVVAAILHLGNIKFAKGEDNDSSVVKKRNVLIPSLNENRTSHVITCLVCNPNALEDALCKRIMITPEEVIKRSLDPVVIIPLYGWWTKLRTMISSKEHDIRLLLRAWVF
ncbi:hypothetical protein G4B88_011067 [Cannabis sativa]|uniref:Myosin motor domain-containing protein n=1 Tax=Cannabis sativa TaxID=3483 RepID=A0A7J6DKZ7_CANSA|nr:hypothetical protein G4B88_011067 [Cannabis sativa]